MSEEDWPKAGPGLGEYDPLKDGRSSKLRESGSVKGPGSRGYKTKSPNEILYTIWQDETTRPLFGLNSRTTVRRQIWAANLKKIRQQRPDVTTDELRKAFALFAADCKARRVNVDGKDAWFVFMARWHKYLKAAEVASTATSFEDTIDNTWG